MSMGFDHKLQGDSLVIASILDTHDDIGRLPHEITIKNVKQVEVKDGFAFQSIHVYLSSLSKCDITVRQYLEKLK